MPVAQRLLDTTDRAFRLVVSEQLAGRHVPHPHHGAQVAALAMTRRARAARSRSGRSRRSASATAQSPLSQTLAGVPEARRRPATASRGCSWRSGRAARSRICSRGSTTRASSCSSSASRPRRRACGVRRPAWTCTWSRDGDNDAALRAASIAGPAFYLLRPDGHVGLAGSRVQRGCVRLWFADNHVHTRLAPGAATGCGISYRADAVPAGLSLPRAGCSRRCRDTARVPPPPPRPSGSTTSSTTCIATSCGGCGRRCWRARFPSRSTTGASWQLRRAYPLLSLKPRQWVDEGLKGPAVAMAGIMRRCGSCESKLPSSGVSIFAVMTRLAQRAPAHQSVAGLSRLRHLAGAGGVGGALHARGLQPVRADARRAGAARGAGRRRSSGSTAAATIRTPRSRSRPAPPRGCSRR